MNESTTKIKTKDKKVKLGPVSQLKYVKYMKNASTAWTSQDYTKKKHHQVILHRQLQGRQAKDNQRQLQNDHKQHCRNKKNQKTKLRGRGYAALKTKTRTGTRYHIHCSGHMEGLKHEADWELCEKTTLEGSHECVQARLVPYLEQIACV